MISYKLPSRLNQRICIVTPGQIGSNPRVVKEATALQEAGYDVTVIATKVLPAVEPRDQAVMKQVAWRLLRVDLTERLKWKCARFRQEAARRICRLVASDQLAIEAHSAFTPFLRRVAVSVRADLYIAHYPAALPAAASAANMHQAVLAYDAEDFHLGDWPATSDHDFDRSLVRSIEARYLQKCAHVTAASPGIAKELAREYGIKRPTAVLNTFPLAQSPVNLSPLPSLTKPPSIYWFSQTIGPNRGLEGAVEALARSTSQPQLFLRGSADKHFVTTLKTMAQVSGVAKNLHFLAPESPEKMEVLASEYNFGLVAETEGTLNHSICLANKLFTYILAGCVPLLSNTRAHIEFAEMWSLQELLFDIADSSSLARLIDRLWSDQAVYDEARQKIWRLGRHHLNWEVESDRLIRLVSLSLSCSKALSHV